VILVVFGFDPNMRSAMRRNELVVNVLVRCKAECTFFVTEEAASQMKLDGTGALELELAILSQECTKQQHHQLDLSTQSQDSLRRRPGTCGDRQLNAFKSADQQEKERIPCLKASAQSADDN
jgi:hypothetical protein